MAWFPCIDINFIELLWKTAELLSFHHEKPNVTRGPRAWQLPNWKFNMRLPRKKQNSYINSSVLRKLKFSAIIIWRASGRTLFGGLKMPYSEHNSTTRVNYRRAYNWRPWSSNCKLMFSYLPPSSRQSLARAKCCFSFHCRSLQYLVFLS